MPTLVKSSPEQLLKYAQGLTGAVLDNLPLREAHDPTWPTDAQELSDHQWPFPPANEADPKAHIDQIELVGRQVQRPQGIHLPEAHPALAGGSPARNGQAPRAKVERS